MTNLELQEQWDEFLKTWPATRMRTMELEEYTSGPGSFIHAVEFGLKDLGGIRGGSAFKFGIFKRAVGGEAKEPNEDYKRNDVYAWYAKLGNTPEEAWAKIRERLTQVISAATAADYATIDKIEDLSPSLKWKVAFLYQDRSRPGVIALYKDDALRTAFREIIGADDKNLTRPAIYSQLLKHFQGEDILAIGAKVWDASGLADLSSPAPTKKPSIERPSMPLNLILYGPPGTGKTYNSIRKAVEICDGTSALDGKTPTEIHDRYKKLNSAGRIQFITFHQSYSYEDFVEGIRPVMDETEAGKKTGQIQYQVKDGIFKSACDRAKAIDASKGKSIDKIDWKKVKNVWKMSLGNTQHEDGKIIFDACIAAGEIRLGYGGNLDVSGLRDAAGIDAALSSRKFETSGPIVRFVRTFAHSMSIGDLVIVSQGNRKFRAIGRITSDYRLGKEFDGYEEGYRQARSVEWLWVAPPGGAKSCSLISKINFSQQTLYSIDLPNLIRAEVDALLPEPGEKHETGPLPHVLILDEINRGNIAKIFGELITLIEEDKRLGAPNEIKATLPYSEDDFGVPSNLYLLGTMNTADRSIAFLDSALRRRFEFEEMLPDYSVVKDATKGCGVDVEAMLKAINGRIEDLFDRDHQVGHAYFMRADSMESLRQIFLRKIIPLLQEYFHGDWARVAQVLGGTTGADTLIRQISNGGGRARYEINHAFKDAPAESLAPFFTRVTKGA